MMTWGVVVAGGTGTRFGRRKQLAHLGDRRVLDWSVQALAPACAGVVLVVPVDLAGELEVDGATTVVAGGADRSDSVRAGLAGLGPGATHVLVHDAARPLASAALVDRVVAALAAGERAAIPVVPVTDSLRTSEGEPVDRTRFVAVQTPQGFEVETLRLAHASGASATDDASLLAAIGVPVAHVEGEPTNLKITDPHDLATAQALIEAAS